jgi:hypothetical protein
MNARATIRAVDLVDADEIDVVTFERLERRLTEECGAVRMDVKDLHAEVIDRQASLLRWLLGFFVAQTAALGALLFVLR